jgi:hypothetical protein
LATPSSSRTPGSPNGIPSSISARTNSPSAARIR